MSGSADHAESSQVPGAYASPLEPLLAPDPLQAEAIVDAANALISQCMAERGFEYEDREPYIPGDRTYGVVDVEQAKVYGYRYPADVVDSIDAPDGPVESGGAPAPIPVTPAELALLGEEENWVQVPGEGGRIIGHYDPDGCFWVGTLAVSPDYFRMAELEEQLLEVGTRARSAYQQEEDFQEAFSAWNACITEAGGTAATMDEISGRYISDVLTEQEIEAAVIDVQCKHDSGFLREWSRLRAEAESRLLDESPNLLLEYLEIYEADVERVQ